MKRICDIAAEAVDLIEPSLKRNIETFSKHESHPEFRTATIALEDRRERLIRIIAKAIYEALDQHDQNRNTLAP